MQSIALPTTASGANRALTVTGNSTAEALLSLSPDGSTLGLIGYDLGPGTATPNGTAPATVNRVVGLIDPSGGIDTTTALTDVTSNPRGAVTSNGIDIWVSGAASGLRYTTRSTVGTSTQLSTTVTNLRGVDIFDGQLHISTGSGTAVRIGTVGIGLPTTSGQTITNLPGIPVVSGTVLTSSRSSISTLALLASTPFTWRMIRTLASRNFPSSAALGPRMVLLLLQIRAASLEFPRGIP